MKQEVKKAKTKVKVSYLPVVLCLMSVHFGEHRLIIYVGCAQHSVIAILASRPTSSNIHFHHLTTRNARQPVARKRKLKVQSTTMNAFMFSAPADTDACLMHACTYLRLTCACVVDRNVASQLCNMLAQTNDGEEVILGRSVCLSHFKRYVHSVRVYL